MTGIAFIPIAQITAAPTIMAFQGSSPYKRSMILIDKAKKEPNTLKYGHGRGLFRTSRAHRSFLQKTGIKMKHIPYAGGAQAMTALLERPCGSHPNYPSPLSSGIKRDHPALAVTSSDRIKAYPDSSTLKELGIDVVVEQWQAVLAPKGRPSPSSGPSRGLQEDLQRHSLHHMLESMGEEVKYVDGPEFGKFWEKNWKDTQDLFRQWRYDELTGTSLWSGSVYG